MELRVAINYPELYRSLHSNYRFAGPILYTDSLFKNISDDIEVLSELGKRNWYNSLWINLREFNSSPRLVYPTIRHFNLMRLEIELDCAELERAYIHMPQLEQLYIRNAQLCKHDRKCVADDLIACSKNIVKLVAENIVVHNYSVISSITKLIELNFRNVELRFTSAEIAQFVSNFSQIRSLEFRDMFDGRSVQLYNAIFKHNLTEMVHLKSITFPLEGDFGYKFGLDTRSGKKIKHVAVYSSLFDRPNKNLFTFFQALRDGFLAESRISFHAIKTITYASVDNPFLRLLYGELDYLHGDLLELRQNIDYLRSNGRFVLHKIKTHATPHQFG